jgi:protein-tyrosine phosphatase
MGYNTRAGDARVIDLHTHILPGVDDGVRTEDESVTFARAAVADGVRTVVATPHCKEGFFYVERAEVLERTAALRARLAAEGVDLEVLPGAEVHLAPDLVSRVRDGRAPTLADNGKTLLLELSTSQHPLGLDSVVFQLKLAGIVPVLAHPERIRYFQDDLRRYEAVVRLGAFGQITTGSVLGQFGEDARELAEEMARKGLAHVLASDAHNTRGRPPVMSAARARLAELVGEDRARRMAADVPAALVAGREPEWSLDEAPPPRRVSFLSRLLGR